jgi:ethanolamine utilization protein EutQ (cupin superfamily)
MQDPDITRVFKGPRNEFEVEIVFAREGNQSPKEGHTYDEIIVVTDGVIELKRSDRQEVSTHSKHETIFLPKSTVHQITVKKAPVKLVIIHPERNE